MAIINRGSIHIKDLRDSKGMTCIPLEIDSMLSMQATTCRGNGNPKRLSPKMGMEVLNLLEILMKSPALIHVMSHTSSTLPKQDPLINGSRRLVRGWLLNINAGLRCVQCSTEISEPMCDMLLIETHDPRLEKPSTATDEPRRAYVLIANAEPTCISPNSASEEPKCTTPRTENTDPSRAILRKDNWDPSRIISKSAMVEPKRAYDRRDNEEPKCPMSNSDRPEPRREFPRNAKDAPRC